MPGWMWLIAVAWCVGFGNGKRSAVREMNGVAATIRKALTGKD